MKALIPDHPTNVGNPVTWLRDQYCNQIRRSTVRVWEGESPWGDTKLEAEQRILKDIARGTGLSIDTIRTLLHGEAEKLAAALSTL